MLAVSQLQWLYHYMVHANNENYMDNTYNKHNSNRSKTLISRPKMRLFAIKAVLLQWNGILIMRETHTSFVLSRFLYLQLVLKQSKSFYRKPYSWAHISGFCFPLLCELIKDYEQSANYLCVVRTLFTLNLLYFDYSLVILQIIVWKS